MNRIKEIRRFQAIQVSRYLTSRPQKRFSGRCEYDAVMGMISDAWVEVCYSGSLNSLSRQGRDALYFNVIIVFPGFVADSPHQCIPVDFVHGTKIGYPCHHIMS